VLDRLRIARSVADYDVERDIEEQRAQVACEAALEVLRLQ
jgi:hypothetical protein